MASLRPALRQLSGNGKRAVVIVHHLTAGKTKARGSTDLIAQVDTTLILTRQRGVTTLSARHHRGAEAKLTLNFVHHDSAMTIEASASKEVSTPIKRCGVRAEDKGKVLATIIESPGLSLSRIGTATKLRKETVKAVLDELTSAQASTRARLNLMFPKRDVRLLTELHPVVG